MKAHCAGCQKRISGPTLVVADRPYCAACVYRMETQASVNLADVRRPV